MMPITLAHWLAGSAIVCAVLFALHWFWQRHIHPLLGWPQPVGNEAMPLAFWPYVFIGLVIVGGLFFVGHAAGF